LPRRTTFAVPADRLEKRFAEKNPPMSETEAMREAARCLYCFDAPCIRACPTSIDIPTFIKKIGSGNARGAARTILSANLLGASCARVCPVETLCEGSCVYVHDGRPAIRIGSLQRWALDRGAPADLSEMFPPAARSGKSVGLVGAGPASLACAGTLAILGHDAVIYERGALPGGLNTTGIAPYKFTVEDSIREVESILSLGVRIETGVSVGEDVRADELLSRHDAVFLGLGLGTDSVLDAPGADGPGVVGAVEWIERMKTDGAFAVENVRRAIVVGGGNTAVDAARELRGLGVPSVSIAYRRPAARMRAYAHELDAARREGTVVWEGVAVAEVLRENGAVRAVRLVETEEGRPTDRERGVVPCDLLVLAIGQAKLVDVATSFPGVRCDARGRIVADPRTGQTGNPRVFAGGDALNGGKEVVHAAHDGALAARSIDRLLRGGTVETIEGAPILSTAARPGALRA
jgi:glutamate synthase (NADPH/NADH) small chain